MALLPKDWIDAVHAGLNPVIRDLAVDLPKAVRALRRKLKGKKKEELEHCATVLAEVAEQASRLVWLPEMTAVGVTRGRSAKPEDIDADRCISVLKREFPEVPSDAISLVLRESIFWFYLK